MTASPTQIWTPTAQRIADTNVTHLGRLLGLDDFDALQRFSIEDPAAYWQAVSEFCGIIWSRPYHTYADFSRGREFPRWFVGGELNWVDTVLAWAGQGESAGRLAVIAEREDGGVSQLTYAELKYRVEHFAAGLRTLGLQRGDRVGLLMENGVEATLSLLAIAYIGAIVVPLFSGYGPDAIVSRLGSCGARAFVMTAGFRRRGKLVDTSALIDAVRQRLPLLEILILKSAAEHHPDVPGALDWATIESHGVVSSPSARMSSDDPFMVIYTSGTTGRPKGTVHTHGGFPLKIAHDAAVHFDVKPGDVFCWPADMGWVAGPLVACSALMRGATLVCYDGAPDFPDWSRMSRIIERYKVTQYGSSPTLIRGLAANEALALAGDVSSVRLLITAGETIDPEHFLWFQQSFGCGRNPLINYTGGTEVSGALLSSVIVRPIEPSVFNSASPGIDADVVDSEGQSTRDSVGELAIREPFVGMTQSFWQDDERYLETYWRTVPGRWLHGDLAIHLSDGGFLLRGRSDDTLKVAGKRLGPAEVEEILLDLPAVSEVAAIGVDDPVKGQKLVVFVIPTGGTNQLELEALVGSRIEERLGRPFRPASVHVVTQLPKTKSLKVMRRVIRSIYTDQPAGDLSSLDNETALDEIRRVSPVHIA